MKISLKIPEKNILHALQSVAGAPYSGWVGEYDTEVSIALEKGAEPIVEAVTLTYDREEDPEGTFGGSARFERDAIAAGLASFAASGHTRFMDLLRDDGDHIDAVVADVLLQHIVFGQEI